MRTFNYSGTCRDLGWGMVLMSATVCGATLWWPARRGSAHEAAYVAARMGLIVAAALGLKAVVLVGRSNHVRNQMLGLWKTKSPALLRMRGACVALSQGRTVYWI